MTSLGDSALVLKRKLRSDVVAEENRSQHRHCGEGSRYIAADQLHYAAAAVEYNIEDLPPEIMCLIFSFKYQPRLLLSRTAQSQDSVRTLFRSFGLVSSSFRRMCFDYLRKTPLFINVAHLNLEETAWLANHHAKIGSFRFSSETDLGIAKSLHLLTSCNVSELEVLNIPAMVTPKQAPVDKCDQAAAAGIPLYPGHLFDITEIHSKTHQKHTRSTSEAFQKRYNLCNNIQHHNIRIISNQPLTQNRITRLPNTTSTLFSK